MPNLISSYFNRSFYIKTLMKALNEGLAHALAYMNPKSLTW